MASAKNKRTGRPGATSEVSAVQRRLLEVGRQAGSFHVGAIEKTVDRITALQERAGKKSPVGAVRMLVATQVDVTRRLTHAYTTATRKLYAA